MFRESNIIDINNFILVLLAQVIVLLALFVFNDTIFVLGVILVLFYFFCISILPTSFFIFVALITFAIPSEIIAKKFILNVGVNLYAMDFLFIGAMFVAFLYWIMRYGNTTQCIITKNVTLFILSIPFFIVLSITQGNQLKNIFADARLFLYYSSFFLAIFFIRSKKDVHTILWSMLILGTIGALPRIVESLSTRQYDQTLGTYLSFQRITGYDEINYPIILVSSFSLLLIAVKKYHKAVLWVVLLISLLALLLSYTRGSWIAAIVGIFFIIFMYTFYSPQQVVKLHTIVFSMFTVVLLIIFFDLLGLLPLDLIFGRATLVTTKQVDISSLERITEWVTAYNDFKKSPLVGAGLGYMVKYYAIGVGYKENIFIHNSYLYVLFKMGIIGFVIFISMYITILKVFFQNIRKFEDIDSFGIYLAFGAIIIVLLIKAFSTWHLNTISNVMFIGILFAAIERYPQFHLKR